MDELLQPHILPWKMGKPVACSHRPHENYVRWSAQGTSTAPDTGEPTSAARGVDTAFIPLWNERRLKEPSLKETQKQNSVHWGVWISPGATGISFGISSSIQLLILFNQSPPTARVQSQVSCEHQIHVVVTLGPPEGYSRSPLLHLTQA